MVTRNTLKKILVWVLLLALMLPLIPAVTYADTYGYSEMWIKTDNGKKLAVRAEPNKKAKIIGYAEYGHNVLVDWSYAGNDGWSKLIWGSLGDGYVQTRYLVSEQPAPYKAPEKSKEAELKAQQKKLDEELKSEKEIEPCYIAVRPSRSTGWVNFRVGPSTLTSRITSYPSGKELIAVGETKNWWRAKDMESGKTGYIFKNLTEKLNKPFAEEQVDDKVKLGKLTVNGEFDLVCKLPTDYALQVIDMRGEKIIASITSADITKPLMYLSIAYDELYGEVERMNDLSEEDIDVLKASFEEQDVVTFQDAETGLGTRLLIVREVGNGTDFVSILSVYKGYLVEFTMAPNPNAASQTLTDDQIDSAIKFLTDVMFEPVQA